MEQSESSYSDPDDDFLSRSAGAAAASWNPAFRRDTEAAVDEDDEFFDRYPGPTPKKSDDANDSARIEDGVEPQSPLRQQSISVAQDADAPHDFPRMPSLDVTAQRRPISALYEEDDDDEEALTRDAEQPILAPERSMEEQRQALDETMPHEDARGEESSEPVSSQASQAGDEVEADNYEHQGEVTEMEEALEPSAGASLLQNEEPLPTTESESRMPQPRRSSPKRQAAVPHLERAFTTNFSDSPIEPPSAQPQSIPEAWPSIGDDKTFGELLDRETSISSGRETFEETAAREARNIAAPDSELSRENSKDKLLEAPAAEGPRGIAAPDLDLLPEDEDGPQEEDLAAAWGAALDEDDMLEDTPAGLDPSHFFGEDDDGFLEDEPAPATQRSVQPQTQQQPRAPLTTQYRPSTLQPVTSQPQQSMPSPQFFDPSSHGRAGGTPSTGLHDVYNTLGAQQQAPQQRPSMMPQAQSFSDKSKGGYQSPYDLPMEVVKPRRRQQQQMPQQPTPIQTPPGPPPRSSSFGSPVGPPQVTHPARPAAPSVSSLSPPSSRDSAGSGGVSVPAPAKSTPKTSSGFFEELPITAKPRNRPAGAYTPQPATGIPTPPPQPQPMSSPRAPNPQQQPHPTSRAPPQPPVAQQTHAYGQLRQPERMPLLPEQPAVQQPQHPNTSAPAPPVAATQSRYSPAPTSQPPAANTRYSPAPTAQPMQAKPRQTSAPTSAPSGVQQANLFAPRTSSPLAAYTDKPHPPLPAQPPTSSSITPSSPPKVNGLRRSPPESGLSSKYSPVDPRGAQPTAQFGPPLQRPRTQSPETTMKQPQLARPTSVGIPSGAQPGMRPKGPALPHRRQFSRELSFAPPQDDRAHDPLQRWKGHPILKWTASGMVVSTFPKYTPFYAAGQGMPGVKCTPGPISVQDAAHFMPMDERNAKFPGPLAARSKGRKKDVLAWMVGKIGDLEQQTAHAMMDFSMPADLKKRAEEKLILWKIMRVFVEHDGVLDGNPKIEDEVRAMLLPNLAQLAQIADLQSPGSSVVERDAVDKHVTLQLKQALLEGRREHAVWLAEEKRLWGHAMLIASTMGPETWKQIVQAFVRNQVKSFGSDARSLAALYQVFAGNSEECVDELVPPSARAGFQMINMANGGVAGNPLEGLDQWKETLGLVTGNRTANDAQSLIALGKLLASYGRVEAAQTCYLFARAHVKHSGADDTEAHFVLLGANHEASDEGFGNDLDSIILTEIYEYAISLSASSTTPPYIPHLQAYKLLHAQELAGHGLKTKAQTYCDAITSAYTSTTRPSPYYHPNFTQSVADMSAFLSQTPLDGKSGFLSRPALNKVSSSATNWFTKFVAGDDDQSSTASGPAGSGDAMSGPFGGVNGDSGSISWNASNPDLYGSSMGGTPNPALQQPFAPSSAPSRYTPGAPTGTIKHTPAQPYGGIGMPAADPQRPGSSRYTPAPSVGSNLGIPGPELRRKSSNYSLPNSSRRGSGQDNSSQGSYEPRPILADDASPYSYSPQVHSPPVHSPAVSSPLVLAQQAPPVLEAEDAFGGPNGMPAPLNAEEDVVDEEFGGGYLPPTSGYEPPSYSYQPYEPESDSPGESRPKQSALGDDDDDAETEKRAAALKKAQADREADEMFRKAAEADAARGKDSKTGGQKKGWFGGWFAGGGGKDPMASPGPIKAKLGEENSFYFDKDLGKWINKKAGADSATTSAAPTPPPPRGPSSRIASATMGPPSAPPSRNTSAPLNNMSRPPTSGSNAAFSGPPSGTPSRSATPASNPASFEPQQTLNLAPNGESLATSIGQPPIRPASSLSNASSIDDLLGGPPGAGGGARKAGGTIKGKKKGGRYVDVMANQ